MHRIFYLIAAAVLFSGPLSAQCELVATATAEECDSLAGTYTARVVITGGDGQSVSFPEYEFSLPLPLDTLLLVSAEVGVFDVLIQSGEGEDACEAVLTFEPPLGCEFVDNGGNCWASIMVESVSDCGTPATLRAESSGRGPFTYAWSTGEDTEVITVEPGRNDYRVTVTDANGCAAVGFAHLSTEANFIHVVSAGDPCTGESPTLRAEVLLGTGPFTYRWSDGQTTRTISAEIETQYTVTVTDANGCRFEGFGFYHPSTFNNFLEVTGPERIGCDGEPVEVSVRNPTPGFVYQWIQGRDTLVGRTVTLDRGGFYDVIGFDPANPDCRSQGHFSLEDDNVSAEELIILALDTGCEEEHSRGGCYLLTSINGGSASINSHDVAWAREGTVVFTGSTYACLQQPGDYTVTLRTSCDTAVIDFTIPETEGRCVEFCGTVVMDNDGDCQPDGDFSDQGFQFALLVNRLTGLSYPVHLDDSGSFCVNVPKGGYTIELPGGGMTISPDCEQPETRAVMDIQEPMTTDLFARVGEAEAAAETVSSVGNRDEVANLRVYPNPTSGTIRFDLDNQTAAATDRVQLYDGLGRLVEEAELAAVRDFWRPANLGAGVYYLTLIDRAGVLKGRTRVVVR